ncbi:dTDP-4-dehydrorhamnose reductase [Mucilaginibacter koreensis]
MKVFLTGASGILGSDILNVLQQEGHEVLGFNSANIELGNLANVKQKVLDFRPEVVIHSAAMTNVDLCEDDNAAAITTNVIGSQNLAQVAAQVNARIVYISSCGVYGNGKTTPYTELDETQPLNYHHYTKLEGEKRVKEHNKDFLIIRPGWLFGGTTQHRKNFVEARRKEAINSTLLKSAFDKVGSPTYTLDLAKQLITLLQGGYLGTFNVVNEGCASRYDYVAEIVKLFNLPAQVEAVDSKAFPRRAAMPDNECLDNMYLRLRNINQMPHWKEAIKNYITHTYNI